MIHTMKLLTSPQSSPLMTPGSHRPWHRPHFHEYTCVYAEFQLNVCFEVRMTLSTDVTTLVYLMTTAAAAVEKHVGVIEDDLSLIKNELLITLLWMKNNSKLIPWLVSGRTRVGVVSRDSVPAWLLLPGGSTLNKTSQSWLQSSHPGQVIAVMRLDNRKVSCLMWLCAADETSDKIRS